MCELVGNLERTVSMKEFDGLLATTAKPRILHVSADFPDSIDSFKTPVVRSLVDLTQDRFDHEVISLNRRSPRILKFGKGLITGRGSPELAVGGEPFSHGQALIYEAPPFGLFHATMLWRLGDWLTKDRAGAPPPHLLVGHKLTIEGIAVRRASRQLGVPFAICIQGDTDTKVLAARPDLTAEFSKVFHEAAVIFPFTPWALRQFEDRLGRRTGPTVLLPCPTDLDVPSVPRAGGNRFVSVFHLKNYRRKNLHGIVAALRILQKDKAEVGFDIIGGGSEQEFERCRSIARDLGNVIFEGPLDRSALRQRLNRAMGFVLPSLRESFGLVFIEALFAGLPVIYPKGTAIDGYFDGFSFAIGVDSNDPSAIAAAMRTVVREEQNLKADLLQWQESEHAKQFMRSTIGRVFAVGLSRALEIHESATPL